MFSALYPPSPTAVPADYTKPHARYSLFVALTLASIVLFVVLYGLLLVGAGYWAYAAARFRFEHYSGKLALAHFAFVVALLLLPAFLLKFLFKKRAQGPDNRLRLVPAEQPELFAFVQQLCREAGAPMPKHIYLSSEVNAAVSYDSTLRSLFLPTDKNLLIGLGLVNGLNLTEFKAVLAHEFGHFGQRSMKLGSYVHAVSGLIHDMVYQRDKWDEMLENWRRADIRVSWLAWLLSGVVWVVRKVLQLCYQGIHLVHASLSREMEFQADRVAVRLAGSDAIVRSLYQLGPVSDALQTALNQLGLALEHQLATDDVFYHQSLYLTERLAARPAPAPAAPGQPARLFRPDEVTVVQMYASHPADYLREEQAQTPFVPGPTDERPAWVLFRNAEALRQQITRRLYPDYAPDEAAPAVRPAPEVEAFLAAERDEMTYHPKYGDTYERRIATAPDPDALAELSAETTLPGHTSAEAHAALFGPELRARTAAHEQRRADLQKISLFQQKLTKDATFTVNGQTYAAADAEMVAAGLRQQNEDYFAEAEQFDRQAAVLHYRLFAQAPAAQRDEWLARYRFHYGIVRAYDAVRALELEADQLTDQIRGHKELTSALATHYCAELEKQRRRLLAALDDARAVPTLPLAHLSLEAHATLASFVLDSRPTPGPSLFNNEWISGFLRFLSTSEERLRRLYFKNLGVLLRLQEAVVDGAGSAQP